MNYKSFNLGDWIGHISGVIEDESELDGNEMRDLIEFLSTLKQEPKKESEKCNYTIQNDLVVDDCRHKPVASTFSFFNECGDYKFCPYCGRKIKIEVEK